MIEHAPTCGMKPKARLPMGRQLSTVRFWYRGAERTLFEAVELVGNVISQEQASQRIRRGWGPQKAVETPPNATRRKILCRRGHDLTGDNRRKTPSGSIYCVQCNAERYIAKRERIKEARR